MDGTWFALFALLPAVFAFLGYGYLFASRSDAKKATSAFGFTSTGDADLQAHRASEFPENWWTGEKLFELERRAIFSKQWTCITHRSHFTKPGDYRTFQLAHFPIFLILGKDHVIRTFHNVCRHRAYTVTKKKSGSSTVLGCRYHGWSYDTHGKLVKAPAFEDIENFDRSQNGLFEIHTHTTRQGFVFVNLSTDKVTAPDVKLVDILARSWGISERSAPLVQLDLQEDVNWKQAVSYMEKTGFAASVVPSAWLDLASKMPFLASIAGQEAHATLDSHGLSSLHVSHSGRLWYTFSTSPLSVDRTMFTCDVYLNWPGDTPADGAIQAIRQEVQSLLSRAKNAAGDPDAASRIQTGILSNLTAHLKEERRAGREVWPASRESTVSAKYNQADLLCKQLSCLKPKTTPDMDLLGKLGQRSELEW